MREHVLRYAFRADRQAAREVRVPSMFNSLEVKVLFTT
jgi:hypothetical protein